MRQIPRRDMNLFSFIFWVPIVILSSIHFYIGIVISDHQPQPSNPVCHVHHLRVVGMDKDEAIYIKIEKKGKRTSTQVHIYVLII